jgi:hypothetical protein
MENEMSQLGAMRAGASSWEDACPGRIEEQIIRAYVQLAFMPNGANGSRAITLAQFGALEARLTEVPLAEPLSDIPSFWVEIYSYASGHTVDNCGCFEFDEDELAAAVELIIEAKQSQPALN